MNITDLYQKIKRILDDSNTSLLNRGFEQVDSLCDIPDEIAKGGTINRLPLVYSGLITELTLEDMEGFVSIRPYMFAGWGHKLTSITIPNSVTSIGDRAFYYCEELTDIYLSPVTPPTLFDSWAIPQITTIHVPIGSGNAYKSATNWSYHSSRIVEDVEVV